MPRKASKAPKERINIVYRPAANPTEKVELPFKVLVLADLSGDDDGSPMEDRKSVQVDKDNFAAVMAEQNLKTKVLVKNRLGDDPDDALGAELKFKSLRDFTPGGIAEQVPELKKLLELREALTALKSPLGNKRDFRRRIEQILDDPTAKQQMLAELGLKEPDA